MEWEFHLFQSLDTTRLFHLLKLRTDVFVVEQQCAYPELDSHDIHPDTLHLLGSNDNTVTAYARAMPSCKSSNPGSESVVRIGRVVVAPAHRGSGVAQQLMQTLLTRLDSDFPNHDQVLSAQEPIIDFYQAFGFTVESDSYLEDGIPHIDMRRSLPPAAAHSGQTNSQ